VFLFNHSNGLPQVQSKTISHGLTEKTSKLARKCKQLVSKHRKRGPTEEKLPLKERAKNGKKMQFISKHKRN